MSERFILESSECSVVEDQFDISLNLFDENINSTEYYNMSKCSYPCTPSNICLRLVVVFFHCYNI